jgi:cbb3-type cytochrome oxidase subunit 3
MQNRVVSIASLMVVVASVIFFLAGAWGVMSQRLDEGSGVMAMAGWLIAAIVFAYRSADPKWLDPVSIVKLR